MAGTIANNFRVLIAQGAVNFSTDTFKAIAMQEGFIFDHTTDDLYADVSSQELATGYGYTAGGVAMSGVSITQNDTDNRADITWNNITWTATGGDVGPIAGVVIYDDTITGDPIVAYINFGGASSIADGGTATVANVKVRI